MELRTGQGTMSSSLPALFCLGLCLEQVIHAHYGPLPKPSLQALPSSLVPLGTPVTVRCQGPPGVDLYRLEKLKSSQYFDYGVLSFSAMEKRFAGVYRCSYQNGSRWSLPSSQLELVATGNWKRGGWVCWDVRPLGYVVLSSGLQEGDDGDDDDGVFTKPSLSAQPSAAVSPGMDVTLRCESQYGFDRFALYKEGDTGPYKRPEQWYLADFPITTVTAANSGTYRCYSFSSSSPYLWSAPSDPLELVVKGNSVTPSWLPTELPSSVTESSEAPGRLSPSLVNQGSTAESSRNITILPEASDPPAGPALQRYTEGNLVRICLGAVVLIFLVGILAEDWHSRRKPLRRRVRAAHRPLPPLPPRPQN